MLRRSETALQQYIRCLILKDFFIIVSSYHCEKGDDHITHDIFQLTKVASISFNEFYNNHSKKNYATNKTDKYYTDETWSMNLLDLGNYALKNDKVDRYIFIVFDNFIKIARTRKTKMHKQQNFHWKKVLKFQSFKKKTKPNWDRWCFGFCKQNFYYNRFSTTEYH